MSHNAPRSRDARPYLLLLAAFIIIADRLSKLWIVAHIAPGHAITIIPGVFRLTHVLNTGAAFSMFEGAQHQQFVLDALIGFSALVVVVMIAILWRIGRNFSMMSLSLALILGGALGNLYDRAHLHYVVDFLEVHIIRYHWPDFNVADSAICVGACLLLFEMLRPQHTER
ncbi:MAG: signal peptidase II [Bryocella sp.]